MKATRRVALSGTVVASTTAAEQERITRFNRRGLVVLAAVVLASQGLYLLNRGTFWDGAAYLHGLETGRYPELKEHFWRCGSPASYYVHRFAGLFPAPILAYRVMYLGSQILTSCFLYRLVSRLPVPRRVALTAGVFSVLMPFSLVSFDLSLLVTGLYVTFFVVGVEWLLAAAQSEKRTVSIPRQVAALVLLAASFFHGTCLFIAMSAAAASAAPLAGTRRWREAALARLRTWPDVHLLPFAFLIAKDVFFKPYGRYKGYNTLLPLSAEQLETWLLIPARYGQRLYEVISPEGFSVRGLSIVVSMAIGIVGVLYWKRRLLRTPLVETDRWPWRSRFRAVGVSLALVYLTILPHFLVGRQDVSFEGFISRDNMVVSLPAGALLAIVLFALLPRFSTVSLILAAAIAMRLIVFQTVLARTWLGEDLKLKMIASLLQELPEIRGAGIVVFEDFTTRFNHLEWVEFQRVLNTAFGDEKRIAFNTWELDRAPSLEACVKAFTPKRGEPYDALAGARDARGCGLVVEARITPLDTNPPSWEDYSVGRAGGEPLRALARTRIKVVATPLTTLPCAGS